MQANAFLELAELRQRKERAHLLATNAMAARGKADDITSKIRKDWGEE